jgi:hypothetical protein
VKRQDRALKDFVAQIEGFFGEREEVITVVKAE